MEEEDEEEDVLRLSVTRPPLSTIVVDERRDGEDGEGEEEEDADAVAANESDDNDDDDADGPTESTNFF